MADSKFARDQMEKYGWVSGSGLGKEQQGMLNPIKVSVKNNKKGVGHDPSKEFTNNWWDQMFNKTAKSISVDNHEDGVSVKTVIEEKKETKKSVLYGNFIKTSTLTNSMNGRSTEVRDESLVVEEEEEVLKSSKYIVSDEEMFRKCGGRTAHKGARHGLKLNGKLQRIEEHEAMLMAEFLKRKNTENGNDVEDGSKPKKKKKKKKNKEKEDVTSGVCEDIEDDDDDDDDKVCNNEMTRDTKSKPRKKKKRSKLEAEMEDDSNDNDSKKHKKKKKRKEKSIEMMDLCENGDIANLDNGCESESDSKISSNKNENDINEDTDKIKKKKKKKRKKQESDD